MNHLLNRAFDPEVVDKDPLPLARAVGSEGGLVGQCGIPQWSKWTILFVAIREWLFYPPPSAVFPIEYFGPHRDEKPIDSLFGQFGIDPVAYRRLDAASPIKFANK